MTDTDKLNLIKEHAREYYENSREYEFFDNGFISYEIFDAFGIDAMAVYFADIFVSKNARGGDTLKHIVNFCESLEHSHNVKRAYCKVERSNKYLHNIQAMYAKVGFEFYSSDEDNFYYELAR